MDGQKALRAEGRFIARNAEHVGKRVPRFQVGSVFELGSVRRARAAEKDPDVERALRRSSFRSQA